MELGRALLFPEIGTVPNLGIQTGFRLTMPPTTSPVPVARGNTAGRVLVRFPGQCSGSIREELLLSNCPGGAAWGRLPAEARSGFCFLSQLLSARLRRTRAW